MRDGLHHHSPSYRIVYFTVFHRVSEYYVVWTPNLMPIWGSVSYMGSREEPARVDLMQTTPTSAQRRSFKKCQGELSLLAPIERPK